MAARKLKFKPKPLIGATVRRARDKDDLPEMIPKESPLTENCKEKPCDESKSGVDLPKAEVSSYSPDCALNKLQIEYSTSASVQSENSLVNSEITSRPTVLDSVFSTVSNVNSVSNSQDKSLENTNLKNINIEPISDGTLSNNCSASVVTSDCNFIENAKDDSLTIAFDVPTKDSALCDQTTKKPDSNKVFPRFGRSKCKPVLGNHGPRKKNNVALELNNISNSSISDVSTVRTESVIKSVKSELIKSNLLVTEIPEKVPQSRSEDSYEPIVTKESCLNETLSLALENKDKSRENDKSRLQCEDVQDKPLGESLATNSSENNVLSKSVVLKEPEPTLNSVIVSAISNKCKDITSKEDDKLTENNTDLLNTNIISPSISNKIPISPFKTPSKVLVPKPSPRLSDVVSRKISVQGSDSEDETKKKILHSQNDIPQKATSKESKENSTNKNKKRKRSQGPTYSKMGQDTIEKFTKKFGTDEEPDKSKLTMLDLIFYNPKSNPMTINEQEKKAANGLKKIEVSEAVEEILDEQKVDDIEPTAMPVPQLKVGPDGQVMLDPKSLVIEATGMEKSREMLEKSEVIQETGLTRYSTYSKRKSPRYDWSHLETLQFYRALNTIGSDFALMSKLFPKRSRHDLKLKFKREEKINMHLIDKAMTSPADFDFKYLAEEIQLENEEIERKILEKAQAKEAAKKERAIKKGEKYKAKKNKTRGGKREKLARLSALREFNETDRGKIHLRKTDVKNLRNRKKNNSKQKQEDLVDSDLEMDMEIDLDSTSEEEEDEGLALCHLVRETFKKGNIAKTESKLEEYEEINESLKQKLHPESDSEEDLYTPNGIEADMLFGSPLKGPSNGPDDKQWNIEISSLPTIEETVLLDNVEEVSEISELGSFGENDTALDLSMPVRANIPKEFLQERHDSSLLNRHIISESIQIIDQLTCNVDNSDVYAEQEVVKADISEEVVTNEDQIRLSNIDRLPSFDSVSRSRPSVVYSLQESVIDIQGNGLIQSNDGPNIVLSNYFNDAEQSILGD